MKKSIAVVASAGILGIAIIIESIVLPLIYKGIGRFQQTGKPIGGILFPASFLHLLLGVVCLISIAYLAEKADFKIGGITPKTKEAWIQVAFLLIFLTSGVFLWYYPFVVLPLILSGLYLVITEIR